jgi:hypothetical protein
MFARTYKYGLETAMLSRQAVDILGQLHLTMPQCYILLNHNTASVLALHFLSGIFSRLRLCGALRLARGAEAKHRH